MSSKLGWAIGGMISMLILQATGFVANQAQNADTLFGMKAMMSVIPVAVGIFALGLLVFGYKLDEKTMDGIQAELEERRKLKEQA